LGYSSFPAIGCLDANESAEQVALTQTEISVNAASGEITKTEPYSKEEKQNRFPA
jgi:hypothetical protein